MNRMIAEIGRIAAGAGAAVAMFVAFDRLAPAAQIMVHKLAYADGYITQDRTVEGRGPLIARWDAEILHGQSRDPVCRGHGYWPYPLGRATPRIELEEWVGDPGCLARLQGGVTYQPCAKYTWADGVSTRQCGLGFQK